MFEQLKKACIKKFGRYDVNLLDNLHYYEVFLTFDNDRVELFDICETEEMNNDKFRKKFGKKNVRFGSYMEITLEDYIEDNEIDDKVYA